MTFQIVHPTHPDHDYEARQAYLEDEAADAREEERETRHAPAPSAEVLALVDRVVFVTLVCGCGATLEVARDFAPAHCSMCGAPLEEAA